MKRSEINEVIDKAKKRLSEYKISLPMFAYWNLQDWQNSEKDLARIKERMLGWDVTDFGSGDFEVCGAVLFTVRNGDKNDKNLSMPYAEKYIILSDAKEQKIPLHYHIEKTEDIINRGGGILVVELYNKTKNGELDFENDVAVYMDGIKYLVKPGSPIEVTPGNSITIEPYVYHNLYAKKDAGLLIVGEVSRVNDDNNDNVFYEKSDRFCEIEEDEPISYPLVSDWGN